MKRLTFFQSTPSLQEFQLQENDVTSMVMKFHPAQQTVRISYAGVKRLYLFEKSGSKLLIRNEYGVVVGKIVYDKWYHSNGSIELDGKKFHHEVNRDEDSLVLFDKKKQDPLVTCTILSKTIIKQVHAALMLTLCRYLLMPEIEGVLVR
jgi:hypothetical protein